MTERARAGSSAASCAQGARARAPPRPAATRASRKQPTAACGTEGAARADRPATASATARIAYGTATASAAAATWRSRLTSLARTTQRPARHSSAPGSRTRPSGSSPIRPVPASAKPTWLPMSQQVAAVRSTPGSPSPACGAAIQPITTSSTRMTRPIPAAAPAAMAPRTASDRPPLDGARLSPGSGRVCRTEPVTKLKPGNFRAPARGGAPGRMPPELAPSGQNAVAVTPAARPARRLRCRSAGLHELANQLSGAARRPAHPHADFLQRFLLGLRRTG